jgi:hypothetical protein
VQRVASSGLKPRTARAFSGASSPRTPPVGHQDATHPLALRRGAADRGAYSGRFLGKPWRAIFRFRHQDAQTPPSPRVGEGGRGDEGATAHGNAGASLPGTRPLRGARASGAHAGGDARAPGANSGARVLAGAGWLASPGVPSPVSGSRTPRLPLLPLWEKGAGGDEGATAHGNAGASLPGTRPLRGARASGAHAGGDARAPGANSGARVLAGAGWLASPGVPSPVSGSRTPRLPLLPLWEKGAGGDEGATAHGNAGASLPGTRPLRGARASGAHAGGDARAPGANSGAHALAGQVGWQAPACHLPFQAAGRPNTPFCLCGGEGLRKSHRGRFLGKPRRAISRFRQQDAQTPLLPVWEKGARGDEGTRGMRDTFVPTLTRRRCPATRTERRGALAGANSLARRNTLAGRADAAILAGLRPNAGARRPAAERS